VRCDALQSLVVGQISEKRQLVLCASDYRDSDSRGSAPAPAPPGWLSGLASGALQSWWAF
jgi:hypothetical protein